jgi:hypothetical protein
MSALFWVCNKVHDSIRLKERCKEKGLLIWYSVDKQVLSFVVVCKRLQTKIRKLRH